MFPSIPHLLSLALSASALIPAVAAAADQPGLSRRQNGLNAASVSTAEFKSRFVQSGIVPEVIAALDPPVSFYAAYKSAGGRDALLVPGSTLTVAEASFPFEFSVENLANATGITANTRYLIYLLDADAPDRSDPTARNLRHYLAGNYTVTSTTSSLLPTAQRLTLPAPNANPFTRFQAPAPVANTGVHRFIYALYMQPANFNTANFDSVGMSTVTSNWSLADWRMQLGLGPALGATFFTIDTGANGGQGTSGRVDPFAGSGSGSGPGSGPGSGAGHNVPAYALALAGTLLALM